jgi:hypothetical protein
MKKLASVRDDGENAEETVRIAARVASLCIGSAEIRAGRTAGAAICAQACA